MWKQLSFFLSQCTRLTDGRTDGRTKRPCNTVRCITCTYVCVCHAVAR